ncbi:hypothetical protein [Prevotella sp. HMSC073D09]|nr:hypothetical protein [Prevotella sp. HMSC073D09]
MYKYAPDAVLIKALQKDSAEKRRWLGHTDGWQTKGKLTDELA